MNAPERVKEAQGFDIYEADQQKWLDSISTAWPARWKRDVLAIHTQKRVSTGDQSANLWLLDIAGKINACRIAPNASDADILAIAENQAKRATEHANKWSASGPAKMRRKLDKLCSEWGIEPPGEKTKDSGALARMTDPLWWRRKPTQTTRPSASSPGATNARSSRPRLTEPRKTTRANSSC